MDVIAEERDAFIASHNPDEPGSDLLSNVKHKILTSLKTHWDGLSVFIEHPEVPMDNNNGENSIRNPVTGRKNFYGSGSVWSSQLAAIMFSIFKTMVLCKINCHHWLRSYLSACAKNHSKAPEDLSAFLRKKNLNLITNNARFLILPWIRSKNLASKILSLMARHLPDDWKTRYNIRPVLLESFVRKDRFAGICYKAANWINIGETKGRGKLGEAGKISVPIKDIWVFPLNKKFRLLLKN